MTPTNVQKVVGYAVVITVLLAIVCFFGMYVTIADGIFAGLMLQGVFFPPIEKFYLVTNGSNRFLLEPMVHLYRLWPNISWFDLTQIVPGIIVLLVTLYVCYSSLLRTFNGKGALLVAIGFTTLLGVVFVESTILYDPLSSSLLLPLVVLLFPQFCSQKWAKAGAYVLLSMLLLLCWQIRYQGVIVGFIPAVVLLGLVRLAPLAFIRQYKFSLLLIGATFVLLIIGSKVQDRSITPEEAQIALLDQYIYTFSDGKLAKPGSYDITDPADSMKLIAYYTFYFAEPTDTALAYMKNITYPSVFDGDPWAELPIKWNLFWEPAPEDTPISYHNYWRFMGYMALANGLFLLWAFLFAPSPAWRWKALLWTLFVWAYFIALGVTVKMIYKLAAPLSFFFLFGFLWLALQIWRERKTSSKFLTPMAVLAFGMFIFIGVNQLQTYATIKFERQNGLRLKQDIVTEINTLFSDKLLVFDFFSLTVLEDEIGADNTTRDLKPKATMFGDFYMSLFPTNKKHLETLTGTSDFVAFFNYCAINPQKVVLVMSKHRIDLIQSYLRHVKGIELDFLPLEGNYKIEELYYSFYEVPLLLNYYTVKPKTYIP